MSTKNRFEFMNQLGVAVGEIRANLAGYQFDVALWNMLVLLEMLEEANISPDWKSLYKDIKLTMDTRARLTPQGHHSVLEGKQIQFDLDIKNVYLELFGRLNKFLWDGRYFMVDRYSAMTQEDMDKIEDTDDNWVEN